MTYPVPSLKKKSPGERRMDQHFKEIELGATTGQFSDGRAYVLEDWFDTDTGFFVRTIFYSVQGIKDWPADRHLEFAEQHDLLAAQEEIHAHSPPGIRIMRDDNGREMWSVSYVMKADD